MSSSENSGGAGSVFAGKQLPCPVCGESRDLRTDKKGKPYIGCEPCGVQVFVRNQLGISLLAKKLQAPKKIGLPMFRE